MVYTDTIRKVRTVTASRFISLLIFGFIFQMDLFFRSNLTELVCSNAGTEVKPRDPIKTITDLSLQS